MDIDGENTVADWLALFEPPDSFPWHDPRPHEIITRRAQMANVLLFDVLLTTGGIRQPDMYYPPSTFSALRPLLQAIHGSTYDSLKKDCLVYMLLKWYPDGRDKSFHTERCIPPQFVSLADAYWLLDTGADIPKAVSMLSDARLNRDYSSKILQAISLAKNPSPLIVKYVRTAQPLLTDPDDIDLYTLALADMGLFSAWQYQRTFPEKTETRSRLIRKVLSWCLSPHPRPQALTLLMAYPFSKYEESILHEYALHPPKDILSSSVSIIHEFICVRLIQSGQYGAAIKLDRQLSGSIRGADSNQVKKMQERRRMMDEILSSMSVVERLVIEEEMEMDGQPAHTAKLPSSGSRQSTSNGATVTDLSRSWEEVSSIFPPLNGGAKRAADLFASDAPASQPSATSLFSANGTPDMTSRKVLAPPTSNKVASAINHFSLSLSSSLSNNARSPNPLVRPSGLRPAAGLFSKSTATSDAIRSSSLFETIGSANQTPNAFYKPPTTNGVNYFPSKELLISAIITPPQSDVDHAEQQPRSDIEMESENEPAEAPADTNGFTADVPSELSFSVFGNARTVKESPPSKQRGEKKLPPGAFHSEASDDSEPEATLPAKSSHPSSRRSQPARQSRIHNMDETAQLKQNIPGALLPEDDEVDDDDIGPLPTATNRRPARNGRPSKSRSFTENTAPRRSSRLSTTSSAASSPERASPQKAPAQRKSTRASTTTEAVSTRSSTRKKR